jgi:CheY-like chemotaxis protein
VVNQKVATMMLRSMGFFVTVASDGEKAVSEFHAAAANGEPFDVVLMDLQMPLMDGLEAARAIVGAAGEANGNGNAIQGRAPAVAVAAPRIVALTADVAASVIQECRAAGMHGFLGTFFCFCFQDSDYFAGLSEYCLRILCHKT